jgi:hypothetical protein
MRFAWDSAKAEANERKHGVAFDEASTVFGDTLSVSGRDLEHSVGESRWPGPTSRPNWPPSTAPACSVWCKTCTRPARTTRHFCTLVSPWPASDVLKPYKATIDRWLWPDVFKNQDTFGRQGQKGHLRLQEGCRARPVGGAGGTDGVLLRAGGRLQQRRRYAGRSLVRRAVADVRAGLKTIATLPEEARPAFWARLDAVRDISHNFGYGVGDGMDDLLTEYGVDD